MLKGIIRTAAVALTAGLVLPFAVVVLAGTTASTVADERPAAARPTREGEITVYFAAQDRTAVVDIEQHLVGVLAGEIPASFSPEALKAQAVAARSYILYMKGRASHENGADVCTDYRHCKAWLSEEELESRCGEGTAAAIEAFKAAVEATRGEILTYGGMPALTVFHAMSGSGATEAAVEVWGGDYPYLVSVPSDDSSFPGYESTVTLDMERFWEIAAQVGASPEGGRPYAVLERGEGGGVASCMVGGVELTGAQARSLFELRSTDFMAEVESDSITFRVEGSGHGVGLSQCGAQSMASAGCGYAEILSHYYPGCTLEQYNLEAEGQQ